MANVAALIGASADCFLELQTSPTWPDENITSSPPRRVSRIVMVLRYRPILTFLGEEAG